MRCTIVLLFLFGCYWPEPLILPQTVEYTVYGEGSIAAAIIVNGKYVEYFSTIGNEKYIMDNKIV